MNTLPGQPNLFSFIQRLTNVSWNHSRIRKKKKFATDTFKCFSMCFLLQRPLANSITMSVCGKLVAAVIVSCFSLTFCLLSLSPHAENESCDVHDLLFALKSTE